MQVGTVTDVKGGLLVTESDMVTAFNDYFVTVFTSQDTSHIPTPVNLNLNCNFSDLCFREQDVLKYLSKLWPDKAAGADEISPWFLFQLKDCISYQCFCYFVKVSTKMLFLPTGNVQKLDNL